MKHTNLEALNNHLFEAIEMLKNNSDPKASANEKIDLETARAITGLGKVIVEGMKVKAQVINMLVDASSSDPNTYTHAKQLAANWEVTNE